MVERVEIGSHVLYRADCRDVLDEIGRVDAVVTDPPYGANCEKFNRPQFVKHRANSSWDRQTVPDELMQSVIQTGKWAAIFGGNYYLMPPSRCWLVWDKYQSGLSFADCELCWTNFPGSTRRLRFASRLNDSEKGDHPTQKPVGVMSWVIGHIPGEPKTIFDPFMGSGTTGVACANAGIRFIGIEREQDYFDTACKRIAYAESQLRLFA